MTVAEIIIDQIQTLDKMALLAWGTSKALSIPEIDGEHLGGVKLLIQNNPNIPEKATVEITLNGSDLYDIKISSPKKVYFNERDWFCGDIVAVIDQVVG